MRYFSMFSGIGGFELGIQNAFEKHQARNTHEPHSDDHTDKLEPNTVPVCVGYSEIDKYAIATYENNFKGHTNYGDATKIDSLGLPDFDTLVGGFPCQAFSVAGKRLGFNETRGTLFFEIARILSDKRPRHLVLENVKGLLSHDSGKTFQTILKVLTDLGYRVEWQVLNSKDFGVPQNRERVYIIGHLGEGCSGQVLPITRNERTNIASSQPTSQGTQSISTRHLDRNGGLLSPIASTVQATETPHIVQINQPVHSNDRVYSEVGISPTLNTMQGGNRQPFIAKEARIRRLTPIECERLQGFPDNWTIGNDTQRYKQCGNAVTVNVVQAVMEKLRDCL